MDKFFKLLKEELESIDILNKPEHIFNAGDTGIDLNARSVKVIVCKVADMLIQNKRRQEIISLPWFAVQLLDKSWNQLSYSKKIGHQGPILEMVLMVVYMESHLMGTWMRNFFSHGLKRYLLLEPHMYDQVY